MSAWRPGTSRFVEKSTSVLVSTHLKVYATTPPGNTGVPFHGACIDPGAETSDIGCLLADAYARFCGHTPRVCTPRGRQFCFGNKRPFPCVETLATHVPLYDDLTLPLDMDVIDLIVPLLIGLETLDPSKLYLNNGTN